MRILTIATDLGIGGTQRVAQNLSVGLAAAGDEVAFLAHRRGGPREIQLERAGIPVFTPERNDGIEGAIKSAQSWAPDIVHIHRTGRPNSFETSLLTALKSNGRRVVETNVFARYDWTRGGRLIDAHCQLSKWCSFKWKSWAGPQASPPKSFILPNAVDPNSITPLSPAEKKSARQRYNLPDDGFLFGRIGQPLEDKWDPSIFAAFTTVAKDHKEIFLILVGAPKSYEDIIGSLEKEVSSRIYSLPTTSDDSVLREYFGCLDAFLHVSRVGESFGMVLCESMMSGIPVITQSTPFRDNSQLEVVGHDRGGIVTFDTQGTIEAMRMIIGDTSIAHRVKNEGQEWVSSRFSQELVSANLRKLYQHLLGERKFECLPASMTDEVDIKWIEEILQDGVGGKMTKLDWLKFNTIHNTTFYKSYTSAKSVFDRIKQARSS